MELCGRCRNVIEEGTRTQLCVLESQCNIQDGAPCGPCHQLQELEVQIAQVQAFVDHLKGRRLPIKTERNRVHDPLIRTFPPELMSRIFSFYVFSSSETADLESYESPLFLGSVCRAWRKIAWDTPSLWSSVRLMINRPSSQLVSKLSRQIKLLEQGLSRSGILPLALCIYSPLNPLYDPPAGENTTWKSLIDILTRYSERWRALDIQLLVWSNSPITRGLTCGFPNLAHLSIIPDQVDPHRRFRIFGSSSAADIPAPAVVKLAHLHFKDIKISWANVVHLELSYLSHDKCIEILQQAPQVTYFSSRAIHQARLDSQVLIAPVTHQRLRVLECQETKDTGSLLTLLSLPSLENVQCSNYMHFPFSGIKQLVLQSLCPLKKLQARGDLFKSEDDLIDLLSNLPSIEILMIHDKGPLSAGMTDRFLSLFSQSTLGSEASIFLPNLENFTYQGSTLHFRWGSLLHLFSPGSLEGSTGKLARPLTLVHIRSVMGDFTPTIPKDVVLAFLDSHSKQGVQFKIDQLDFLAGADGEDFLSESMKHHGISQTKDGKYSGGEDVDAEMT